MRLPLAAELLHVWEGTRRQPPFQQALALLGLALPDLAGEPLRQLSLGRRDALLLELRELLFGRHFNSVANCPRCRERVELSFATEHLRVTEALSLPSISDRQEMAWQADEYEMQLRLPDSNDLAALVGCDEAGARRLLLERCVSAVTAAGEPVALPTLPPAVIARITQQLADADPQADTQLAVNCPACRHLWTECFDIGAWLMAEINDWAQRLLREVHTLALAYGWHEKDILMMHASRRRAYLELLGRA